MKDRWCLILNKILFIRSKSAFLPEIDAYIDYFNRTQDFIAYDSSKLNKNYKHDDFDVIWEFKGFAGANITEQLLVHEYASLSTGEFPKVKNLLKSKLNSKPDIRIFLNENVKDGFYFKDGIDFCFRDMGIDERFIKLKNVKKEYDFVYVGSISKAREIDKLLEKFTREKSGKLCLVGNPEDKIFNSYKNNKDIIFTGKIPYSQVPEIASKAVYGINYMPDKYPFNIQTSTKLLEYLALGLKVITTDYKWVRQFEKKYGCSFYRISNDIENLNLDQIKKHTFKSDFNPCMFLWKEIIDKSDITTKLMSLTRNIK